jgi:hypothetical protein
MNWAKRASSAADLQTYGFPWHDHRTVQRTR